MANTNEKYLDLEGKQDKRPTVTTPVRGLSKDSKTSMENVDLFPEDDQEYVQVDKDDEGATSDEYEFVHHEFKTPGGTRTRVPSETFRGTWQGAYQESARAASDVKKASYAYASAIANSNVTRAGLSIGSAFASTANRSALVVADKALKASGKEPSRLPWIVRNWLRTKDEMDESKRKAAAAKEEREERKLLEKMIAQGKALAPPSRAASPAGSGHVVKVTGRNITKNQGPVLRSGFTPDTKFQVDPFNVSSQHGNTDSTGIDRGKDSSSSGEEDEEGNEDEIQSQDSSKPIFSLDASPPGTPSPWAHEVSDTYEHEESDAQHFKTPSHVSGVFNNLLTPDTVRAKLQKPLQLSSPSSIAQSPYLAQDDAGSGMLEPESPSMGREH